MNSKMLQLIVNELNNREIEKLLNSQELSW